MVRRRRLFDRLAARSAVLVLGPAGYGKSVLLASWLAEARPEGAVVWLTLDPSDRDPGRLAADLLTAMRTPGAGHLATLLERLEDPPLFADHLAFVDTLQQTLVDEEVALTLVLDDLHHLVGSPRALELVDHFMAWAPPSCRVLLASRSMPQLRLQKLRLDGRLELVGHSDLAFTREETAVAVGLWGLGLGPDAVAELHTLTQGWPAATRLAVLAVRAGARTDLHDVRRDDALAEYLTTEVLGSLDPDLREFVLDATIDELVCPSLLDAVRSSTDSAALLERCAQDGLFLNRESGAGDEPWFRWHGLFASNLRLPRLARPHSAQAAERRAALWWRSVDPDVAVSHALAARDDELAGEIAASVWLDLVLAGQSDTARRLAAAVPDDVTDAAELHLATAFVTAEEGAVDVARLELERARELSHRLPPSARTQFEMRATVIELFVVRDRVALTESLARGHRLVVESEAGSVSLDRATMALLKLYVGMSEARLLDRPLEAVRLLRQAHLTANESGYTALGLMAQAETCIPSIATGRLDDAQALARDVLAQANAKGWGDLPGIAMASGYLGWLALWKGEPRRAIALLDRCEATLLPHDWAMLGLVTTVLAQACLSAGDVEGAERAAERGRELATHDRMPPWWPSLVLALDAMVLMERGHVEEARVMAQHPADGPEFHLATCFRGCVLLRSGRPQETLDVLDTIPAERMFPHVSGVVDTLRAQALAEFGDRQLAHEALERALDTSQRYGFLEPFRLVGDVLTPLLTEHSSTGTRHGDLVLRVLAHLSSNLPTSVNDWGETLTERERTILHYLATDMSPSEIATAEFISVNTVKTHLAHVYRKLDVANRRAAVRHATQLGLI
ncbi:LuxR C-terminal-related transcriptional regulator [Humibacillus xanthopallidus]|uniref:LuxR C-terminal-related transcriptional regulator n=1 Tax=Humibacillus xanthopallidus TaxID=412689 RepID=UPI0011517BC8|nr:LuxR C-terminal-related transcriptional regulator [Humibacillus xanthopallidus]